MKSPFLSLLIFALNLACITVCIASPANESSVQAPLAFTKNMGQWPDSVLFRADAGDATMWLMQGSVCYQFTKQIIAGDPLSRDESPLSWYTQDGYNHKVDSVETQLIKVTFVGCNTNFQVVAQGLMEYKCNYFLGEDPAKWKTDVPNYEEITLRNVYDGVDLRFFTGADSKLAYQYELSPNADINQITLSYESLGAISADNQVPSVADMKSREIHGLLAIPADADQLLLRASQSNSEKVKAISQSDFNRASLPVGLVYSTYLGGSTNDQGYDIAVDGAGCAYVTGRTASTDFPTENAHDGSYSGGDYDVFVTKFSSDGSSLIYSTYMGGSDIDIGRGLAVDGSGCAYVTGYTYSSDFPTANAFDGSYNAYADAFVAKLSVTGNSLDYSTFLGGSHLDYGNAIAVDGSGCAFVTGAAGSADFPTQNAYDNTKNGYDDIFVTKFSAAGNTLIYSTFLGGDFYDWGADIAIDVSGCAYVAGHAYSTNFPTQNAYDDSHNGSGLNYDGVVAKLSSGGNSLVYSTYLGGANNDYGYGIAIDGSGCAYIAGYTNSSDFPTQNPFSGSLGGSYDAFVTKLHSAGNSLLFSTYLGGYYSDYCSDIAIDGSGCAYVTGQTWVWDFPTENPYDSGYNLFSDDAFVTKFSATGNSLIYSTYLGGSYEEYGRGIAVDAFGCAYVTGYTESTDFPTENAFDDSYGGGDYDIFLTKLTFDADEDGVENDVDNCPTMYNPSQTDSDTDGSGDPCDICPGFFDSEDADGDTVPDGCDICPGFPDGEDSDEDGVPDGCDICPGFADADDYDNDTVPDSCDNCPEVYNPDQTDTNENGIGDECDYLCGDANADQTVNVADAVYIINYVFKGGPAPDPMEAGDANGDCSVNVADGVYIVNYVFKGGDPPICNEECTWP